MAALVLFLGGPGRRLRGGQSPGRRSGGLVAMAVFPADPICFTESVALQADAPAIGLALDALALAVEVCVGAPGAASPLVGRNRLRNMSLAIAGSLAAAIAVLLPFVFD
jgi:hypothetical protein